ncbi:MAG: ComEC/Rec2 family competence protein [Planctomycetaceae bacterium]|nr:ComEC/Rec2 family competence protein [Planctomycetaceae bacterium]
MTISLSDDTLSSVVRRRAPGVPVVLAFVLGIVVDANVAAVGWWGWALSATALLFAGLMWWLHCSRLLTCCLLFVVVGVGAVRHHDVWFVGEPNDIGLFAQEQPRPARVVGTIAERPQLIREKDEESSRPWASRERSVLVIECRKLRDGDQWFDVTGGVRVDVSGLASKLRIGDEVELLGRLSLPDGPRNVGEFNFAEFLRKQGIHAVLRCRSLDAVQFLKRPDDLVSQTQRQRVAAREHCEQLLRDKLSSDTAPVAMALLLGSRSRMTSQQREAFVESGTMHVLAISGLNVAILAMFVGFVCRLLNLPRGLTAISIFALVGGYAAITDAGPPVVRSALLVFLATLAWPWDRPTNANNLLAFTALGVLWWNPTDTFNTGAQLSFLAVAVILWLSTRRGWQSVETQLKAEQDAAKLTAKTEAEVARELAERLPKTAIRKALLGGWSKLRDGTAVSFFVWLFSSVLIARQFHLVSPVGLLANLPLIPVATVTLCLGYSMLLVGFVSSTVAGWIAVPFEWSLRLMLWIVDVAAEFSCGHRYVPTPPMWWLVGAFVCLATLFWWMRGPLRRHLGWRAFWLWTAIGLVAPLWPREPQPLRVSVLSVGHGLSVLIESPSGRTLLYDGGMMGNGRRANDVVQQTLWHRGHSQLDGLVLSHADTDHVNGVAGLLRTLPVGRIFVSPQFVDWNQSEVRQVLDTAQHCRVPVRLTWQGDSFPLGDGIRCRVLHPTANEKLSPDNANSIVLLIEYAGRRFLLTGDLERDGLLRLLKSPPQQCDVLLSPHHGSLGANTTDLARWARPNWLIVSADRRANLATLRSRFGPDTTVLSTADRGAITFEIQADGRLTCETFRVSIANDEPVRE